MMSAPSFFRRLFYKARAEPRPPSEPPPALRAEIRAKTHDHTSSFQAVVASTRRHSTASCNRFRTESGALLAETRTFMKTVARADDALASDPGVTVEG